MGPTIVVAIVFLVVSLLLLGVGYLIGVKKQLGLIAGYDPSQVRDQDGLARWVGRGLMIMGGVDAVISLAIFVVPQAISSIVAIYMVVVFVGVVALIAGARKYAR